MKCQHNGCAYTRMIDHISHSSFTILKLSRAQMTFQMGPRESGQYVLENCRPSLSLGTWQEVKTFELSDGDCFKIGLDTIKPNKLLGFDFRLFPRMGCFWVFSSADNYTANTRPGVDQPRAFHSSDDRDRVRAAGMGRVWHQQLAHGHLHQGRRILLQSCCKIFVQSSLFGATFTCMYHVVAYWLT